jgi:hypothetical protein
MSEPIKRVGTTFIGEVVIPGLYKVVQTCVCQDKFYMLILRGDGCDYELWRVDSETAKTDQIGILPNENYVKGEKE